MKNSIVLFAAVLFTFFSLTSCQKDEIKDLSPQVKTSQSLRNVPAGGIHTVNEAAMTQYTMTQDAKEAAGRDEIINLDCMSGVVSATTEGEINNVDTEMVACMSDYEPFDGADKAFLFTVEEDPNTTTSYHIALQNLQEDLDLFVFTLNMDAQILECKAKSITIGYDDEHIELTNLGAGTYIIIVDAWTAGITSSFDLDFYCTSVGVSPPVVALTDNIHSMTFRHTSNQSSGELFQINGTDTWFFNQIFDASSTEPTPNRKYTEIERTPTTITLGWEGQGHTLILDLENETVSYTMNNDAPVKIGTIEGVYEFFPRMSDVLRICGYENGLNNLSATFMKTSYEEKSWVIHEFYDNQVIDHDMKETSRDDTSVFLSNELEDEFELDLERMKVVYSSPEIGPFDIGDISSIHLALPIF